MHPDFYRADRWTRQVIGAAIEVHRDKGPGLLEGIYKKCLMHELGLRNVPAKREVVVPIRYKDYVFDEPLRLDVLIDGCLIMRRKPLKRYFLFMYRS